ncbi:septal ring lytic transglycosylase RlpA family protein [Uliginosibacterium sediminicola]|uniref:Endolytic peptidoglycan transglycosylase RlpA n=1 Tax=Uliginosibacterium sediminicola TaxID=2024550 RepID=A0ABU9YVH9_9RHOO
MRRCAGYGLALLSLLLAACASPPVARVETRPPPPATRLPDARPEARVEARPAETRPPASASSSSRKGGGYYKDDGPGDNPPDLASIPNAQPRAEPLLARANRPYEALGLSFTPMQQLQPYRARGTASWYGRRFHGAKTSSGEPYDMYGMTAAHPTLPIPSYVRVTNLANGNSVIARVNDRGPFHKGRLIDLSYTAAWKLGYADKGSAEVEVEAIIPEEVNMIASNIPPLRNVKAPAPLPAPASEPVADVGALLASLPEASAPAASSAPPADSSVSPASLANGVYLQLGAFSSLRNAESFREYALQALRPMQQNIAIVAEGQRYRLHMGPFSSADDARSASTLVTSRLRLNPFIVYPQRQALN